VKKPYPWEKDLADIGVQTEKINELKREVDGKIKTGQILLWSAVAAAILIIVCIIVFIGVVNVLQWKVDSRYKLVNGLTSFFLVVVSFLSPYVPIKPTTISADEVNGIVSPLNITSSIMQKIRSSVEEKTSGFQRLSQGIAGLGVITSVVLSFVS